MSNDLRLRIREDLTAGKCHVEVLDKDDRVLGDLAGSVVYGGVKWEMSGGMGPDKGALIRELAPIIEQMESRYPEHVIAERLIDAYEAKRGLSGPSRGMGLVTITLACERARVDTIEVPDGNAPKRCGAPADGGPCVLPAGHNMGQVDIPEKHRAL